MNKTNFDLALKNGSKKLHIKRQKQLDKAYDYHKFFHDKNGNIDSKYLELRNCPICNKNNFVFLFKKNGGNYVRCKNKSCQLVYLNPCFKDVHLESYYKKMGIAQSITVKDESLFYRKIYSYGITNINKFIKPKKEINILDLGCSTGFFLDIAKEKGWKTFGIELNEKEIDIAKRNHNVKNINLHEVQEKLNYKFNVITMWDVIEHVKNPHDLLKTIKKSLKPGGLFFFQTPNVNSLAARILQEKCNVFDGIEHVNLFNENNIYTIAKKNKFKLLSVESIISEIPIISNYLNNDHPYLGSSKEKKILGILDDKILHKKYLGYKMQVVFKSI
jgi:2-polyprenyl-3-methyl-5-hydroxy-6-metoxy-1,4-benzoquinol methylase